MKQLFLFIVLLLVVGIAGFLYRATLQAPTHNTNSMNVLCPSDIKTCADGSTVTRQGASCEFAVCALPNVELAQARVAFVLPAGFTENKSAKGDDASLLAAYEKNTRNASSTNSLPDALVVRSYPIPAGKDANSVMLAETMYETSGMQPESMSAFTPVIINGKTYQMITVERFEAQVHVLYYLPREKDVLRFEALQHDVTNWTEPTLNIRTLSTVKALELLLGTLKAI